MRIAVVQHGDYAHARRLMAEGKPEIYTGQRYTVEAFDRFFAVNGTGEVPHLIVGINGTSAPEQHGQGRYACVNVPRVKVLPGRIAIALMAWRIKRMVKQFQPTHLVLRCTNQIGIVLLEWANAKRIPTAVMTAMRFDPASPLSRRFCELASDDNVVLVANHNRVATETMHKSGLRPGKGEPYDFPPKIDPKDFPAKSFPTGPARTVTFAGVVSEPKGVLDLLHAAERLHAKGRQVNLVILGDGPARAQILAHPGSAAGWIKCPGRVGQSEVVQHMRDGDFVVVPSQHRYPEGMPFVIAEGLATRTPLLLSDHPIFVEYFPEGSAVRHFPAGDDAALATLLDTLWDNSAEYERLSRDSADAWRSFQVETKFHHLLERLNGMWNEPSLRSPK